MKLTHLITGKTVVIAISLEKPHFFGLNDVQNKIEK